MFLYGKKIYKLLREVRHIMEKSQAQIDNIVELAGELISHNRNLVVALRDANARAQANAEELALFKSNDAAEDAAALAAADEELAGYAEGKAAQLRAQLEAEAPAPAPEPSPEPAAEPVAEPEPAAETPAESGLSDVAEATDDASVIVLEPGDVAVVPGEDEEKPDEV